MENNLLKNLLNEYAQKRYLAEQKSEHKKIKIYSLNKNLEKIENDINFYSIKKINLILNLSDENKIKLNEIEILLNKLKNEKKEILNSLSINEKDLLPDYECKICNDTGYVKKDNITSMCSCLKQKIFDIEYNKSNIGNLEKENFLNFHFNLYSDEINSPLNISPRENIKIIKNISEKFIKNFDNPEEKNLLFTGSTGLGKTFLCNCIANEILKLGKTVLYQTAPVMIDTIIDYRFNKINTDIINNLLNVDLLIIDDLGTEDLNSMKLKELFTIINTRILNQNNKITKTIISTNLNINEIFSIYNERIGSRIARLL